MPALSEYTNVYNTALNVLKKKGFQSWYDEETDLFCAEKDGWDFMADSPCGLLGVVTIVEFIQPKNHEEYWWRVEDEQLYRNIPSEPKKYVSVTYKGINV